MCTRTFIEALAVLFFRLTGVDHDSLMPIADGICSWIFAIRHSGVNYCSASELRSLSHDVHRHHYVDFHSFPALHFPGVDSGRGQRGLSIDSQTERLTTIRLML